MSIATTLANVLISALSLCLLSQASLAEERKGSDVFGLSLQQLLEITVTARKSEEQFSDVPLAMTVLDRQTLDSIHAFTLFELGRDTSAFFIDPGNNFGVRGIYSGTPNIGLESGNSLFIDGNYSLNPLNSLLLMDIERIELLKGSQSTFYGRNTMAGAINVVPRAPELHHNRIEGQLLAGEYSQQDLLANANIAVGERTATRISFGHLQNDGFIRNNYDGSDLRDRNLDALRWQWLFDNQQWQVKWSNDFTESQRHTLDGQLRSPSTPASAARLDALRQNLGLSGADTPTSSRRVNINTPKTALDEHWGSHLTVSTRLGSRTRFTSISSRRSLLRESDQDDEDHLPIFLLSASTDERWLMSNQEFRLNHEFNQALSFSAGFYWERQKIRSFDTIHGSEQILPLLGINQSEETHMAYRSVVSSTTRALFTSMDYALTDTLSLSAGARMNFDAKQLAFEQKGGCYLEAGELQNLCFFPQIEHGDQLSDHAFMPTLSLSFSPNAKNRVFVRFAEGIKSAGFNADVVQSGVPTNAGFDNAFLPDITSEVDMRLNQENLRSYEIGYRGLLGGDSWFVQSALYHFDYDDFQSSRFTGTEFVAAKDGKAETSGWEFSLGVDQGKGSEISFGLNVATSEYGNYPEGEDNQGNPINHKNKNLVNAPELAAFVRFENYGRLTEHFKWQSNLNFSYRSHYYTAPANGSASRVDDSHRINARLGLLPVDGHWALFLWARNLSNQIDETQNQRNSLTGLEQTTLSEPRSVGIQLKLMLD